MGMNELEVTSLGLHCEGTTEKGSIVDDNGVGTTGLGISGLGETDSSLRCDGCLGRRQSSSKGLPACFYVESSIFLCRHCILFF